MKQRILCRLIQKHVVCVCVAICTVFVTLAYPQVVRGQSTGKVVESKKHGMRIRNGSGLVPAILAVSPPGVDYSRGMPIVQVLESSKSYGVLLPGDLIKGINGTVFTDFESYMREINRCFVGEIVTLWIVRKGEKRTLQVPLDGMSMMNDHIVLRKLLAEEKNVRLGVIISKVHNTILGDKKEKDAWNENRKRSHLATEESTYLGVLSLYKHFSIVDRSKIHTLFEEQQLVHSGAVQNPVEVGKLLGASHILDVAISIGSDPSQPRGFLETITRRLLDVETGEVLATIVVETW